MKSPDEIIQDFNDNIIAFLDELIEQFPTEGDFFIARMFLQNRIAPDLVMNTFIKEILPHKKAIADRDEKFFLNNNLSILNGMDSSKVNHFRVLWKSSMLDDDDRQVIWKWFDLFVYVVGQYQRAKIEN